MNKQERENVGKVAIVVDWLVSFSGAEFVLKNLLILFPEADIFTTVDFMAEEDRGCLKGLKIHTSFIQKLPRAKTHYRQYIGLMPLAVEQFDLSSYDLVFSNSHAVAKGVITGPQQTHVSYVLSPIRYAWDLQHQYLKESGLTKGIKSGLARATLHYLRIWDLRTVNSVDTFLACSTFIARRVEKLYRREAEVVFPPVDCACFSPNEPKEDFYFTSSRMVPYKKLNLIIQSFNQMPDKKLVIGGDGPDRAKLERLAGPNITFKGKLSFKAYKQHLAQAKAFIHMALEDFGIVMVEALASGTPVIAYGQGGSQDIVVEGKNGLLVDQQTEAALIRVINQLEESTLWGPQEIAQSAKKFDSALFQDQMSRLVHQAMSKNRAV